MISEAEKEQVRAATDIVQLVGETVELKQRGQDYWGCCPFHNDKSPSFHVRPQLGVWKCFGCGLSGDAFSFIQQRDGVDFPEAIRILADRAGIELHEERNYTGPKKSRLIACAEAAQEFFQLQLMRSASTEAAAARDYLSQRKLNSELCKRWGIGFAPGHGLLLKHLREKGFTPAEILGCDLVRDIRGQLRDTFFNRIMFPITDETGRFIAFGGRVIGKGEPKYLNSKETTIFHKSKNLFAFDRAKKQMSATNQAIICEGYTDVIALHEAGFSNAVAALGTAFTLDHIHMIERFAKTEIICLFDGDAAGQRAAERSLQYAVETTLNLRCVVLPGGQDPAEFLQSHSAEELAKELDNAQDLIAFVVAKRVENTNIQNLRSVNDSTEAILKLLVPFAHAPLLDNYLAPVSQAFNIDLQQLKGRLLSLAKQTKKPEQNRSAGQSQSSPYDYVDSVSTAQIDPYTDSVSFSQPEPSYAAAKPFVYQRPKEERIQLQLEAECLSFMCEHLSAMEACSEILAQVNWLKASHMDICIQFMTEGFSKTPQELFSLAKTIDPDVGQEFINTRLSSFSQLPLDKQAAYLAYSLLKASKENERLRLTFDINHKQMEADERRQLIRARSELMLELQELKNLIASIVN